MPLRAHSLKLYPFVDAILMPIKFKCQRYFKLPFTAEFLNSSLNFIIEPPYHNWNANIFSSFDKKSKNFARLWRTPLDVCSSENWTLHFTH